MKKLIAITINSLFLMFSLSLTAQEDEKEKKRYEYEKKKTYEKSYPVSPADKIKIYNQFGSVKLSTWDKNEVKVSVEMVASAKSESRANDILQSLSVSDKKTNNVISFKTSIDNDGENRGGSNTMEINYTVYMPNNNALDLKNEFGPIEMGDFGGNADITSKFGSLTTGKLSNVDEILVEFGKAKIESITNGTATFKFSKADVNHVKGNINLKFEFCDKSSVKLDNDATIVNINESYSSLYVIPAVNYSASYDVRTSFGSFKNRTDIKFNRTDESPEYGTDSDREYEGNAGSGTHKVKIKSSFGRIILGAPSAEEMKEKKKKGKKSEDDEDEEA